MGSVYHSPEHMGQHAKAMELALRGTPEQVRGQVGRVLRVGVERDPELAKNVAAHMIRRVGTSFRRAGAAWTNPVALLAVHPNQPKNEPKPPNYHLAGLPLFVGGITDIREALRQGPMFAAFANGVAEGFFQICLAEPIAHHAEPNEGLWHAAYALAAGNDPEPLERLMAEAVVAPRVREDLMANLRHLAWSFDVGGSL